jgi:hypothetical protein
VNLQPNFREGDEWGADTLNQIISALQGLGVDIRVGPGLYGRRSASGQIQISMASGLKFPFVGTVGTSGISIRSGATLGHGTVHVYVKTPGTQVYVDSGRTEDCDNISSTTGGIPSGTWVVCAYQEDGTPVVTSVDCGN